MEIEQLNRWMVLDPLFVIWRSMRNKIWRCPISSKILACGEIAGSFAQATQQGELSRFRICTNPDCLWVYYDDTRNRSKRYCDDKMCGNLMKVRRFRAKKSESSNSED